jgi:hypothetical protein
MNDLLSALHKIMNDPRSSTVVDTITQHPLMNMVAVIATIGIINNYLLKKLRKLSWLASISDDPKVNKPPVVDGTYHLLQDVQSGGPSTSGREKHH